MAKGIYKLTNNRTGEVYIGQAKNLESRKNRHLREMAQGKHHNAGMQNDHNLGDTFSFEILEELPNATKAELYNKESQYIRKYNSFREGYNQTPGGAMDQFKGKYEYGGGRLPVHKYKPIEQHTPILENCSKCGNPLNVEDTYCSNCGEKVITNQDNEISNSQFSDIITLILDIVLVNVFISSFVGPFLLLGFVGYGSTLALILMIMASISVITCIIMTIVGIIDKKGSDIAVGIIFMLWNLFIGIICSYYVFTSY